MITREEAKENAIILLKSFQSRLGASVESLGSDEDDIFLWNRIDETIKDLEAQLSNTEQLTCEGCRYKYALMVDNNAPCYKCAVNPYIINHYNKKDTK